MDFLQYKNPSGSRVFCSSSAIESWKSFCVFFFFNDTATTEIYTLSLHDALPICLGFGGTGAEMDSAGLAGFAAAADRKSTRLNSSHANISYAVFCLQKKKIKGDVGDEVSIDVVVVVTLVDWLYLHRGHTDVL